MRSLSKIALLIVILGTIAMAGNYLWLVGMSGKPGDDLMETRWVFGFISYATATFLWWLGEMIAEQ